MISRNKFLVLLVLAVVCLAPDSVLSQTKILFLGDSITAGLGVEKDQAFPALVSKELKRSGILDVKVINAGISGSTSASAISRLKWYLRIKPDILVLELGGNDGLRGLSVKEMKSNLAETIELALKNRMKVILTGMQIPPNYGPTYTKQFKEVFYDLADHYPVTFMPFLLKDVGGRPDLNQPDGIHPTPEGHRIIAKNIIGYILENL